jgi:MFS family permease
MFTGTGPRGIKGFYILLITQALSLIGSRMTSIGLGLWVYQTTGSAAPLLLTAFFNELPGMLGASLAGVLVDRWDRRWAMILADAGQAAGTALLLLSILLGQFQIWHLYAVALLQGVFVLFQDPARAAATTMLVPEQQRERANGIQEMSFPLAGVVAPPLAGLVYAFQGVSGVIFIDLATFLIAVLVVSLMSIPRPRASIEGLAVRGGFIRELHGALGFILRRPPLLYFVLHIIFVNFMLNGPLELGIPYLISVTGNETLVGVLMGVMSLGALSGAALIAIRGKVYSRMRLLALGMVLCSLMFLVYGTARNPFWLGLSIFLLVLPLPVGGALEKSIWQMKTPPDMQGRIFALVSQLGFLGSTASFLLTGPLVDKILEPAVGSPGWKPLEALVGSSPGSGMGLLLVATGAILLAETLLFYALPQVRNLERILPDYEALSEPAEAVRL